MSEDVLTREIAALRQREDELLEAVERGGSPAAWREARRTFERLRALLLQRKPTRKVQDALVALDGLFDRGAATVGLWEEISRNAEAIRRLTDSARRRPSSEERHRDREVFYERRLAQAKRALDSR